MCPSQNVVERVTSLPLVSSTYGLVSSVYTNTKDTHPYIRSVCEAAEQGVRTITSVALTTASPIMGKLEPQSKNCLSVSFQVTCCHPCVDVASNCVAGQNKSKGREVKLYG